MFGRLAIAAFSTIALSLATPGQSASEEKQKEQAASRSEVLNAARDLMKAAHFCALITNGENGHPQARAMDPFEPTEDFHVWLGTKAGTHKTSQIDRDSRVTLYYFSPDSPGYVTLLGNARIVDEPAARQQYWKKEWEAFYEKGNEGPDYVLIEVIPEAVQVVSYDHGIASDPRSWGPATVTFP